MSDVITINTESGLYQEEKFAVYPIYDENYYMLREVMPEYTGEFPNPDLNKIAKNMIHTMRTFAGIGLSANQCGLKLRMFVIGTDDFELVCINPKIVSMSGNGINEKQREGCLSFPGFFVSVSRPSQIHVQYTNLQGELVDTKLSGVTARCFLHELDHLNGIRFIDRVGKTSIMLARERQKKLIKKMTRKMS